MFLFCQTDNQVLTEISKMNVKIQKIQDSIEVLKNNNTEGLLNKLINALDTFQQELESIKNRLENALTRIYHKLHGLEEVPNNEKFDLFSDSILGNLKSLQNKIEVLSKEIKDIHAQINS